VGLRRSLCNPSPRFSRPFLCVCSALVDNSVGANPRDSRSNLSADRRGTGLPPPTIPFHLKRSCFSHHSTARAPDGNTTSLGRTLHLSFVSGPPVPLPCFSLLISLRVVLSRFGTANAHENCRISARVSPRFAPQSAIRHVDNRAALMKGLRVAALSRFRACTIGDAVRGSGPRSFINLVAGSAKGDGRG